jgi:pyruvate dehydrogenase E1 component alpha subunit
MGTPIEKASANTRFYTRGDVTPGIQIDGNNVLMVRETFKFLKSYCPENGPVFLEVLTYRYHG